jgi:hypothetical protein
VFGGEEQLRLFQLEIELLHTIPLPMIASEHNRIWVSQGHLDALHCPLSNEQS